jgi:hypothetical protein
MGKELVVRTENRVGLLADIAKLLSTQGINILATAVFVLGEEAELHLVVDAHRYAWESLRDAGFPAEEREVVLVELPNRPGFLRRVTEALARQGLDIRYLYASAAEDTPYTLVVFSCTHNGKAVLLLRER